MPLTFKLIKIDLETQAQDYTQTGNRVINTDKEYTRQTHNRVREQQTY